MTVTENPASGFDVVVAGIVVASFTTYEAAWRNIDRCDGDPVSKSEQPAYWWLRD